MLLSTANLNHRPASVTAPPKRGPIMVIPEATAWAIGMSAHAANIVARAPLTQGPWSAESMMIRLLSPAVITDRGFKQRLDHDLTVLDCLVNRLRPLRQLFCRDLLGRLYNPFGKELFIGLFNDRT